MIMDCCSCRVLASAAEFAADVLAEASSMPASDCTLPVAAQQAAAALIAGTMHALYLEIRRASNAPGVASAGGSSEAYFEDLAVSWRVMVSQCGRGLRAGSPPLQAALAGSRWIQGMRSHANELEVVAPELQYYPDLIPAFQQLLQF